MSRSAPLVLVTLLVASPWFATAPVAACASSSASQLESTQSANVTSVRYDLFRPLPILRITVQEVKAVLHIYASMPDHAVQRTDAVLGSAAVTSATYITNIPGWIHAGTTDKEGPVRLQFQLSFWFGPVQIYNTPPSQPVDVMPGPFQVQYDASDVITQIQFGMVAPTVTVSGWVSDIPASALSRCGELRASTGAGTSVTSVGCCGVGEIGDTFPPSVSLTIDNVGNNGGFRVHCERQVSTRVDYEFTELSTGSGHLGTLDVTCQ